MDNCLFCKIVRGEIPSTKVYENDKVYAFRDINPQAPTHVLVVPKQHVPSIDGINEMTDSDLAACLRAVREIAAQENLAGGYRVISNCGPDACQSVPHLHFHILGGRKMADQMA
ncbi:MAG: histidine triad nucleotide-binding protein [Clostridiales bacterium]|nr:histidine triad nucleotide-binding protein [Clostridiales bacterium]